LGHQLPRYALALATGMDVEQIETTFFVQSCEANDSVIACAHEDAATGETLGPGRQICDLRRPGSDLIGQVVATGDFTDGALKQGDDRCQIA